MSESGYESVKYKRSAGKLLAWDRLSTEQPCRPKGALIGGAHLP